MLDRLGVTGVLGVLFLLGGVVLLATVSLRVAAGVALVVAGMGMVASGLVKGMMRSFGLA
jgi:hypothetical protein